MIVVTPEGSDSINLPIPNKAKVIFSAGPTRGSLLNDGAAVATGDVFLFLWPDCQLPPDAFSAIGRNLTLLPQTIGGNFHVKFNQKSLFIKFLKYLLKKMRYQGRYYGNSGIFVRCDVFEAMGGFKPYEILEDYDFARRLEKYGPTLYLPNVIVASTQKFQHQKFKTALLWLAMQLLFMVGLQPKKLAQFYREV